jgi:hypothetical protein
MGGNRLISLLVILLLAGVGAYFFSPWFRTKVDDTIKNMKAWDADARRKDPVGFIDYAMKQLGSNVDKFDAVRADLRVATVKLDKMKQENLAKQKFADGQLEAFKTAYKAAKDGNAWPATVGGRPYKEAELKSQVSVLLSERGGFEGILKQVDVSLTNAERKNNELLNRINESKAKLSILGAQRELVKVNQLSAESEKLLNEVQDVLVQNEALAEKPVVRTVEELMRDAGETAGASNPNVDAFLNG